MDLMAEDRERTNGDEEPEDEYRVLPPEPVQAKPTAPIYTALPDEVPDLEPKEEQEGFQFSLGELMSVVTAAAISLGIVCSLPSGGRLQAALGLIGVGLFVSLIVLKHFRPERRILYVVWWTMFVSYLLTGLLAMAGTL